MLNFYRFHADLPMPQPARPVYRKPESGTGWPDHCPPIRAAQAFGWDVINPFTMRFVRDADGAWDIDEAVEVPSDIDLGDGTTPHPQLNAWFWERDQKLPHVISPNVYPLIRHQCKISTYLYLHTEPGWMLIMTGVPNQRRDWRIVTSLIETDWYFPAHPWHTVIELPRIEESDIAEVVIPESEPLCRLVPVQRADYPATEMKGETFGELFAEGQRWLKEHGKKSTDETADADYLDITGQYAREQDNAKFTVEAGDGS
ncbi:MAG: hypothetical protein GC159_07765 [Phycisphaera sp.]|nr:hypothetical protein [Phycisphaera sp.]